MIKSCEYCKKSGKIKDMIETASGKHYHKSCYIHISNEIYEDMVRREKELLSIKKG